MNGDSIETLPTDDSKYNEDIANILFKDKKKINTLFSEFKESLFIAILFIIFSSNGLDEFIIRIFPSSANNRISITLIKCGFIITLFYVFKNFHFSTIKSS